MAQPHLLDPVHQPHLSHIWTLVATRLDGRLHIVMVEVPLVSVSLTTVHSSHKAKRPSVKVVLDSQVTLEKGSINEVAMSDQGAYHFFFSQF